MNVNQTAGTRNEISSSSVAFKSLKDKPHKTIAHKCISVVFNVVKASHFIDL